MLLVNPLAFVAFVAAGPRTRLNHLYSLYRRFRASAAGKQIVKHSNSKAFRITANDNLKVHKESALAPQPVSQSVLSLARLPICSWLSVVSFNVSWNWCCRLAEKGNENAISCTVDIVLLTIQWFFNVRRFNLAACLLFTDSKVFRKNF